MWSWKVTLSQTVPCGIPERTSPSNSMTEYKTWFLGSLHKVRWDGSIYMERRMQEPTTLISSKLSHLPHQMSVWSCSCYLQRFPNTYAPPVLIRPELAFTAVYAYQGLLTINRREGYCSLCFSHPSSLSLHLPTPHPCQAFTLFLHFGTAKLLWNSSLQYAFCKSPTPIWTRRPTNPSSKEVVVYITGVVYKPAPFSHQGAQRMLASSV